jgi:hypothetical protein
MQVFQPGHAGKLHLCRKSKKQQNNSPRTTKKQCTGGKLNLKWMMALKKNISLKRRGI